LPKQQFTTKQIKRTKAGMQLAEIYKKPQAKIMGNTTKPIRKQSL